ncbi:MAG: hypothetical protein RL585_2219 [Pseudomonadota bacterium]
MDRSSRGLFQNTLLSPGQTSDLAASVRASTAKYLLSSAGSVIEW